MFISFYSDTSVDIYTFFQKYNCSTCSFQALTLPQQLGGPFGSGSPLRLVVYPLSLHVAFSFNEQSGSFFQPSA